MNKNTEPSRSLAEKLLEEGVAKKTGPWREHSLAVSRAAEYDDYDRLIQLLDSCCAADGTVDLEARMNDVKARYGYYPQGKWDKSFELKEYFEKLAGKNLYEIIRANS